MTNQRGFTLIELLLAISLTASLIGTGSFVLMNTKRNLTVFTQTEMFSNQLKQLKNYSRDYKDEKEWGLKVISPSKFQILKGSIDSSTIVYENEITFPARFSESDWEIWFKKGLGEPDIPKSIRIFGGNKNYKITVTDAGLIETEEL